MRKFLMEFTIGNGFDTAMKLILRDMYRELRKASTGTECNLRMEILKNKSFLIIIDDIVTFDRMTFENKAFLTTFEKRIRASVKTCRCVRFYQLR